MTVPVSCGVDARRHASDLLPPVSVPHLVSGRLRAWEAERVKFLTGCHTGTRGWAETLVVPAPPTAGRRVPLRFHLDPAQAHTLARLSEAKHQFAVAHETDMA